MHVLMYDDVDGDVDGV